MEFFGSERAGDPGLAERVVAGRLRLRRPQVRFDDDGGTARELLTTAVGSKSIHRPCLLYPNKPRQMAALERGDRDI